MARISITANTITRTGLILNDYLEGANADGVSFSNNGSNTHIAVKNTSGGTRTITIQTPQTVAGLAVAELSVTVANGATTLIGPFPAATFNQAGGVVYVDFDSATNVTIAALKLT